MSRPPSRQRLARLARIAQRELLARRLPHGLMSWRYLWPGKDQRILHHRQLWWANGARWPRGLWLLVQLWLWLRWVGWSAWRATWLTLRHQDRVQAAISGLSRPRQAARLLRLALSWCIPPGASVCFGLLADPARALDYVYDHELPAYHLWRSAQLLAARPAGTEPPDSQPPAAARLQDKLALAEALSALGLPMVPTLALIRQTDAAPSLAQQLMALPSPPARLFCKTRSGNQGRGAFTCWRTPSGLVGQGFDGQPLQDSTAVETAWRRLCALDDVLIQPCLANHPQLADWAGSADPADPSRADAITVRCISHWQAGQPAVLSAVLEVPRGLDARTSRPGYSLLPIDPATGELQPWPHPERLPESARQAQARLWARIGDARMLPDWPALVAFSRRAQQGFPAFWAIAWDWVLTPEGPVLLEGNVGWGTLVPQQLLGGLIAGINRR